MKLEVRIGLRKGRGGLKLLRISFMYGFHSKKHLNFTLNPQETPDSHITVLLYTFVLLYHTNLSNFRFVK